MEGSSKPREQCARGLGELSQRILAALGLIAVSPVVMLAAAAVAVQDGFPVFFLQRRIGRNGQPFQLWKLRSMRTGRRGSAVTARGDDRVTPVGRFLRRYKLDELPQLWNVVRGDMLLIGARPEVPEFVDAGSPLWREVLSEKPGITDFSTVHYRNEEEVLAAVADPEDHYRRIVLPHKLSLHLTYRRKRSWLADLQLLAATVIPAVQPPQVVVDDRTHA